MAIQWIGGFTMNARMLLWLPLASILFAAGCMKPFQRDSAFTSAPTKEDAQTKPETMVALGDARAEAAMMPDKQSNVRDTLLSQALQAYQGALERDPNHIPALMGVGAIYTNMNDRDKAIATYERAIKAHPKNAELWFELGRCQGRFKDWNAAVLSLHQATQIEPDNLKYRKMLGLTLARTGRYEEAYAWLSRSMNEAESRYTLGRMMYHLKQYDAGKEQMALALKANPNYEQARDYSDEMIDGNDQVPATVVPASYVKPVSFNVPKGNPPQPISAATQNWDGGLLPSRDMASRPEQTVRR